MIDWLLEARIEFKHHIAFIHQHNRQSAARIEAEIIRRISTLKIFPAAGRRGRLLNTRELPVTNTPYIVIYALSGEVIQILHILHSSQQWPPEE